MPNLMNYLGLQNISQEPSVIAANNDDCSHFRSKVWSLTVFT